MLLVKPEHYIKWTEKENSKKLQVKHWDANVFHRSYLMLAAAQRLCRHLQWLPSTQVCICMVLSFHCWTCSLQMTSISAISSLSSPCSGGAYSCRGPQNDQNVGNVSSAALTQCFCKGFARAQDLFDPPRPIVASNLWDCDFCHWPWSWYGSHSKLFSMPSTFANSPHSELLSLSNFCFGTAFCSVQATTLQLKLRFKKCDALNFHHTFQT